MIKCRYCAKQIENHHDVAAHTRWCAENPNKKKYKKDIPKKCQVCESEFIGKRTTTKTCSIKCARNVDVLTKKLISDKRKKFLKENPEKHPWKRKDKQNSVPCINVKKYLDLKDIQYVEEFTPLNDRAYSIDIAFPHIKVGLEINGNQHYDSTGKLSPYYQERHDLIVKEGWKLIEIHYSQCFSKSSIAEFLNFDIPHDNDGIINSYFELKRRKKINKEISIRQKLKQQTPDKWELRKNEIFNHNIDFSKYGWVARVALILGLAPQKVNAWMKTYHCDFYNGSCFKRKQ